MKKILCYLLIGITILTSGCVTAINSNKIIAIKQRWVGMNVSYSPTTQAPQIMFGWGSTVFQMIPTSTNGPIYSPNYMDTFDLGASINGNSINPFATTISEDTGTGNVILDENTQSSTNNPSYRLGSRFLKSPK